MIQSLWMNVDDSPPPAAEVEAFCQRLRKIVDAGGQIRLVQVYTIARRTAESFVTTLSDDSLAAIAERVAAATALPVTTYGT